MLKAYLLLFGAIVAESIGSIGLKYSDGMTRMVPTAVVIGAYSLSFWLFAIALRDLPLGTSSAIWAGMGILFSVLGGIMFFGERLGWIEILGTTLIVAGTVILSVFARSTHGA